SVSVATYEQDGTKGPFVFCPTQDNTQIPLQSRHLTPTPVVSVSPHCDKTPDVIIR
ncbi:hypothetical protein STEG23_032740, partial [Scotinomys teguina]